MQRHSLCVSLARLPPFIDMADYTLAAIDSSQLIETQESIDMTKSAHYSPKSSRNERRNGLQALSSSYCWAMNAVSANSA